MCKKVMNFKYSLRTAVCLFIASSVFVGFNARVRILDDREDKAMDVIWKDNKHNYLVYGRGWPFAFESFTTFPYHRYYNFEVGYLIVDITIVGCILTFLVLKLEGVSIFLLFKKTFMRFNNIFWYPFNCLREKFWPKIYFSTVIIVLFFGGLLVFLNLLPQPELCKDVIIKKDGTAGLYSTEVYDSYGWPTPLGYHGQGVDRFDLEYIVINLSINFLILFSVAFMWQVLLKMRHNRNHCSGCNGSVRFPVVSKNSSDP